jgi:hypothetical protein
MVGIFPHRPAIVRLVEIVLYKISDERAVVCRYMTFESREEEQAEPRALTPKKHAA